MTIGIYPAAQEFPRVSLNALNEPLPKPLAQSVTDIDGKFSIVSPVKEGLLYARAVRSYRSGSRAVYEWSIKVENQTTLMLTGANAKITPLFSDL